MAQTTSTDTRLDTRAPYPRKPEPNDSRITPPIADPRTRPMLFAAENRDNGNQRKTQDDPPYPPGGSNPPATSAILAAMSMGVASSR